MIRCVGRHMFNSGGGYNDASRGEDAVTQRCGMRNASLSPSTSSMGQTMFAGASG
ncbi:hypothetical protein GGE07_004298 [Sinorhizobium terangae]|nr:hypothetical protein [Sinorhizobium terangae]